MAVHATPADRLAIEDGPLLEGLEGPLDQKKPLHIVMKGTHPSVDDKGIELLFGYSILQRFILMPSVLSEDEDSHRQLPPSVLPQQGLPRLLRDLDLAMLGTDQNGMARFAGNASSESVAILLDGKIERSDIWGKDDIGIVGSNTRLPGN
jgi:hypothetical protein